MSDYKNTLFTIGQFAALHGINKKTLMWYDEVGLFKPVFIGENGYRYYTYYQSTSLETILMLREMNVSLKDIKKFMDNRCARKLSELLGESISEVDESIARLKKIQKALIRNKKAADTILMIDLSEISIVHEKQKKLIIVCSDKNMPFEKEVEAVAGEVKKHDIGKLHQAVYGSLISVEKLRRGYFEDYDGIFIDIGKLAGTKGMHLRPEGMYLKAYYQGNWEGLPGRYKELFKYCEEQGIELCGYAYETGINENMINSMEEYITQIEIQIKTGNERKL